MHVQQYLISARFFLTMGHLVALLMLFSTIENNVEKSMSDSVSTSEKEAATATCMSAIVIGLLCFFFDFCGIFFGTSLFYGLGNMLHIFFHFIGGMLLSWLITDVWNYTSLWPIVICCNFPTAIYEIWCLLSIFVFRIVVY